jgi:VIT1/CCC1 family predicted Fe2+/Mn2+ transporter
MNRFIRALSTGFTFALVYIVLSHLGASVMQYVCVFISFFIFGIILGVTSYIDGYDSKD